MSSENIAEKKLANIEKYKAQRLLMKQGEALSSVDYGPVELFIEPTKHCNIKCRMCCHPDVFDVARKRKPKGAINLADNYYEQLVPLMDEAVFLYAVGVGEPLLTPGISDFLLTAASHELTTWINTNGMVLNDKLSQKLAQAPLGRLVFSISAGEKELYEKVHEGAKWEKLWEGFEAYQRQVEKAGFLGDIYVNFVVQNDNMEELPLLAKRLKKYYVSGISIKPIADIGGIRTPDIYKKSYIPKDDDQIIEQTKKILDDSGITLELDTYTGGCRDDDTRSGICVHPFRTLFVNVFGDVYPCCFADIFEPEELKIGSLENGTTAEEIWYGEKADKVRQRMLDKDYLDGCKKCIAGNLNALHNDHHDDVNDFVSQVWKWRSKAMKPQMKESAETRKNELAKSGGAPFSLWQNNIRDLWNLNAQLNRNGDLLVSKGNDPFMITPVLDNNPGDLRFVILEIETVKKGIHTGQLFWKYSDADNFSEESSVRFTYGSHTECKKETLYFDLTFLYGWDKNRQINMLRIDPLESPGTLKINNIQVF
ncbi:MAG: SPASM domain-containing protein [Deltaproteobacteria bacterium]|nr:SPASM domain-containing protein [Deltaproteobacteria bacterium]